MEDLNRLRRPLEPTVPFPEPLRPLTPSISDDTAKVLREILIRLDRIEERLASIEKMLIARQR